MIPTPEQARALWDVYRLPEAKRRHVTLVAATALFLAQAVQERRPDIRINLPLLEAAALLHDIDKAIPSLPGERHPATGVRILRQEGMAEVADVVATHPVHSLLQPSGGPQTWEERLLYLADKMVKQEVITVDQRFALWLAEPLPETAKTELRDVYPQVKQLEKEVFDLIQLDPAAVAGRIALTQR